MGDRRARRGLRELERRDPRREPGIAVVFGNVAIDRGAIGEDGRVRKLNAAWVCHDGRFMERPGLPAPLPHGVHPKTLHPNYRFFDDDRHFYSLRKIAAETDTRVSEWMIPYDVPTDRGVVRLGVQLCEDIWHQDYRHCHEPLDTLRAWHRAGADLVINLSRIGRIERRLPWLREYRCGRCRVRRRCESRQSRRIAVEVTRFRADRHERMSGRRRRPKGTGGEAQRGCGAPVGVVRTGPETGRPGVG